MISTQELNISNKSYTNKDFASIYQEILDLAKKLSNRFDPETSNESDPFIVLLKLLSFMGDKINYNIDKNILERFMPSATQESSMRNLCEMMGYNMHYYIAPETTITIQYVSDNGLPDGGLSIPRFTYVSNSNTEDENKVNFFIKNRDVNITKKDIVYGTSNEDTYYSAGGDIVVIQGEWKNLTILGNEKIHLDNLDGNNRVYFPERMVAENGIFIKGGIDNKGIETDWIKVDNLNIRDNLFVYKFGYDSLKGLPYIEFPDNISALIGDGLEIKYTITDGLNGNINAKVLNCLTNFSQDDFTLNDDDLKIVNINAAINGRNPESINEAYNGFKKTIGTFNTLVTCRDYMNYIYNLLDDDEIYSLVSNIMVSDRRTDINYTTPIVTFNAGGQTTINTIEQDTNGDDKLTAFDLCLYPLQTYKQDNLDNYINSFEPESNTISIQQRLEESRCISHDYKSLEDNDIYLIKNYLKLTCRVSTTYKVNASEQAKIIENIQKALAHDYNARNIDYGYEIPYDSLLKTIENADVRIKSVTLYEPELNTKIKIKKPNENEIDINSKEGSPAKLNNKTQTIIAKNILAGRYPLFDYDTDFNYEYGQQKINNMDMIYEDIKSVDTETILTVPVQSNDEELVLKDNQQLQIIWPNLITDTVYAYGTKYASNIEIGVNIVYQLDNEEYLALFWTDTEKNQRYKLFKPGDIIKSSFKINKTDDATYNYYLSNNTVTNTSDSSILQTYLNWDNSSNIKNIHVGNFPSTSDTLEYRVINKEIITTTCFCYWSLNNSDNSIFSDPSESEYTLDNGEYFYKTDSSFNSLSIYGAGTTITRGSSLNNFGPVEILDLSEISEQGILGNKELFKQIDCSDAESHNLSFQENNILTLNKDDKCWMESGGSAISNIGNNFTPLTNSDKFRYQLKVSDTSEPLETIEGIVDTFKIRSRLNINSGPNLGQIINAEDTFEFKNKDDEIILLLNVEYILTESEPDDWSTNYTDYYIRDDSVSSYKYTRVTEQSSSPTWESNKYYSRIKNTSYNGDYFKLNDLRQLSGGINTNLAEVNYLVNKGSSERYRLLKLYLYKLTQNYETYEPDYNGYIRKTLDDSLSSYTFNIPNLNKETLIMIWTDKKESGASDIEISFTDGTVKNYYTDDTIMSGSYLSKGLNIISVKDLYAFTLTNSSGESPKPIINIVLSKLSVINGFNSYVEDYILDKIRELDNNRQFYYNYIPDNSKLINEEDILNPYTFYDYNNLYNKWTMSEIDFGNSIIEIARGSRV